MVLGMQAMQIERKDEMGTAYRVEYLDSGTWKIWGGYRYLGTARNSAAKLLSPTRIVEVRRLIIH